MVEEPGKKERYEIMYEELSGKVQLVLEGHSLLNQKIDRVDAKIDGGVRDITRTLNLGFATVIKEIRALHQRFDAHERAHTH